jgi:ATP-binding cassette, subfamily B, bacterial
MEPRRYSLPALSRRLLALARPCSVQLCGVLLLSLISTPIALLTPLPLKIAVDSAIGSAPLPPWVRALWPSALPRSPGTVLGAAVILLLVVALAGRLQELATAMLQTSTSERLTLGFKTQIFRHAQRLSLAYHDTRGTAESVYRLVQDAPAVQYIVVDGLVPFITAGATLGAIVWITARLDWQLALVALGVSPVLFMLSRTYRRRLREGAREVKRLETGALAVVQEVLGNLRVVKAFGQEDRETYRFRDRSREGARARIRQSLVENVFGGLIGMTTAIGTALTVVIGLSHVRSGSLTLGSFLLVMAYLTQLYGPLTMISRKVASLQSHLASMDRAFSLIDEEPDVPERGIRTLTRAAGAVAFRNVSFAYSPDRKILEDVTFELAPGTTLGISGTTGTGKTTLVNLLCRFYDPTAGEIRLDGVDIRDYRLRALRDQFALVLQDPVLFSASIAENIAYARPASDAEIVAAARAANIHDFIERLPDGYQTRVGERGMRLSGGERQRVSLARAFLKDAPILILDEPTSSLDVVTEALVIDAMERLMKGRTTIMIAHRAKTLERCEMRLHLEHGRIQERAGGARAFVRPRRPATAVRGPNV